MTRKRWVAVAIGAAAGVAILVVLRPITENFFRDSAFFKDPHWPLIWAMVFGVGVGAVALAGTRVDPLISAIPAAMIFLVFLPMFIDLSVPSWYPNWVRFRILTSFGLVPYVIIGVLVVASLWPMLVRRWGTSTSTPPGSA